MLKNLIDFIHSKIYTNYYGETFQMEIKQVNYVFVDFPMPFGTSQCCLMSNYMSMWCYTFDMAWGPHS